MDVLYEKEIPSIFDEVDSDDPNNSILRTMIDFEIRDGDDNLVSLDEIGEGRRTGKIIGTLVEPFGAALREAILSLLTTTVPAVELPSESEISKLLPVQRQAKVRLFSLSCNYIYYCSNSSNWFQSHPLEGSNKCEFRHRSSS